MKLFLIILLLLGQVPLDKRPIIERETARAVKSLESKSCRQWLKKIKTSPEKLKPIINRTLYFDGKTSTIPLRYSGILEGMMDFDDPLNKWAERFRFDLIQAELAGRMVVYVFNYDEIKYENIIHEALHYYFVEDDFALADRLGVEVSNLSTMRISSEVRKHCK